MTYKKRGQWSDQKIPDRWTNEELARQISKDLRDDTLWEGRATFRKTAQALLGYWEEGRLNEDGRESLFSIIEFNRIERAKRARPKLVPPPPELVPPPPEAAAPEPVTLTIPFDPDLHAVQIAKGWQLRSGSIVDRLAREHRDFPPPLPRPGRKTVVRSGAALTAWGDRHQADLIAAKARSDAMKARKQK